MRIVVFYRFMICAGLVAGSDGSEGASFEGVGRYRFGEGQFVAPRDAVIGDWNGDGVPDLAVAHFGKGGVTIFDGRGNGQFRRGVNLNLDCGARSIVAADFDMDGHPDLAVACPSGVQMLLHRSAGFTRGILLPARTVTYVAAADLNGDSAPDLIVLEEGAAKGKATVYFGDGKGGFAAGPELGAGSGPREMEMADFDSDGKPDIAILNQTEYADSVSIWLGGNDGSFQRGTAQALSCQRSWPTSLAVGDFNGDKRTDLAVACPDDNAGNVLFGRGDGTFGLPIPFTSAESPLTLGAADFDSDGLTDLVVGHYYNGLILFLRSLGDGKFEETSRVAVYSDTAALKVDDLNSDGRQDVVIVGYSGSVVATALNRGAGKFTEPIQAGEIVPGLASGEFKTGTNSVALTDPATGALVLANEGKDFTVSAQLAPGASAIAAADFDNDGRCDLAVASALTGEIWILLSESGAGFRVERKITVPARPEKLVAGDFDGDGRQDYAVSLPELDQVLLTYGRGDGSFEDPMVLPAPGVLSMLAGHLHSSQAADLIIGQTGKLLVYPAANDRSGLQTNEYEIDFAPAWIAVGDVNSDGRPDLLLMPETASDYVWLAGTEEGGLAPPVKHSLPFSVSGAILDDFTGDGRPDLFVLPSLAAVFASSGSEQFDELLVGAGDGTFQRGQRQGRWLASPMQMISGDWDGDGRRDIAIAFSEYAIAMQNMDAVQQPTGARQRKR